MSSKDKLFPVLRIGAKYKSTYQIRGFRKHMEREIEILNSNGLDNYVLIGNYKNLTREVNRQLKDAKLRKDSVRARDLLLTASPSFFKDINKTEFDRWVELNLEFLNENFKEIVYAILHMDETTPHIHCLLVPKYEGKLSNSYYFNGFKKMKEWQDKYYEKISEVFPQFSRGIEKSKATHMEIQKFYTLITQDLNELDIEQIKAKAKYSELLEIKLRATNKTLEAYKKQNEKLREDNKRIGLELTRSTEKSTLLQKTIDYMALIYKVSERRLNEILDHINGRGRER